MSARNCQHCGEVCDATSGLCAPCELNIVKLALKDAQRERDEARAELTKAYDVIAWMKALPGVSRQMAVSLLRGGR